MTLPKYAHISLLSDVWRDVGRQLGKFDVIYNNILDKVRQRVVINNYHIGDNYGRLVSATHIVDKKNKLTYYVSNLQEAMCYILTNAIFYNPMDLVLYKLASDILEYAETKKITELLPQYTTYGKHNINISSSLNKLRCLGQPAYLPKNAYPTGYNTIPKEFYDYDYLRSDFFRLGGEPNYRIIRFKKVE